MRVQVFKGAMRVPSFAGVPRWILLPLFIVTASAFMFIHFYAVIIAVVVWALAWLASKRDDRLLEILLLSSKTYLRSRFSNPFFDLWQGASRAPTRNWKKIGE